MGGMLAVAAVGEAVTGLALLVYPLIVVRLLFGTEITGAAVVVSRIAGIALIGLGIACRPGVDANRADDRAYGGLLTYSALMTLCLANVGFVGLLRGPLLWPAAIVHLVLTVVLAVAWSANRTRSGDRSESTRQP